MYIHPAKSEARSTGYKVLPRGQSVSLEETPQQTAEFLAYVAQSLDDLQLIKYAADRLKKAQSTSPVVLDWETLDVQQIRPNFFGQIASVGRLPAHVIQPDTLGILIRNFLIERTYYMGKLTMISKYLVSFGVSFSISAIGLGLAIPHLFQKYDTPHLGGLLTSAIIGFMITLVYSGYAILRTVKK